MKHILFLFTSALAFSTSSSRAVTLDCKDTQTSQHYIILASAPDLFKSQNAVLIGANDVVGSFSPLYGSRVVKNYADSVNFTFSEGKVVDWTKIDPDKQCSVRQGESYNFLGLSKNTTGSKDEYQANLTITPYVLIHPKKPNCNVAKPTIIRPNTVLCNTRTLELK